MYNDHRTSISNVLVVGSGGAGLRAAIAAHMAGAEVVVVGKRLKKDAHTVLAAGGINAALGTVDPETMAQIAGFMESTGPFVIALIGLFMSLLFGAIFATIGGLIGGSVFKVADPQPPTDSAPPPVGGDAPPPPVQPSG